MLDFQQIKCQVSYNDVLSFLNLQGKRVGEQWRGKCPACNTDNDRSLVLTEGKGAYCFATQKGGDILWMVSHVKGIGVRQAAQELVDHFRLSTDRNPIDKQLSTIPQEPDGGKPEVPTAAPTETPKDARSLSPLSYLQPSHEAVKALGLDEATATKAGIGWASKGLLRGRVAIPIRLPDGTLVAYCGFAPHADPPLKFPSIFRFPEPA